MRARTRSARARTEGNNSQAPTPNGVCGLGPRTLRAKRCPYCRAKAKLSLGVSAQNLADPLGYGLHLQGRAGDLLEHLLGTHALAFPPELAQQRPRLAGGEPGRAELLLQVRA